MKRRDVFIFVADPDQAAEARSYLGEWLRSLDGHPGYLGGSVLTEVAGELLPNTLVMLMEFESTEAAKALWPKIENTVNPLYPDDKSDTLARPGHGLLRRHQGCGRRRRAAALEVHPRPGQVGPDAAHPRD